MTHNVSDSMLTVGVAPSDSVAACGTFYRQMTRKACTHLCDDGRVRTSSRDVDSALACAGCSMKACCKTSSNSAHCFASISTTSRTVEVEAVFVVDEGPEHTRLGGSVRMISINRQDFSQFTTTNVSIFMHEFKIG